MAERETAYVLDLAKLSFYKTNFAKILWALLLSLGLNLAFGAAFLVIKTQRVEREYFAVDSQTGRLIPMPALGQPYLSKGALLGWFVDCVVATNTYDYVNYQRQLGASAGCFTTSGWGEFTEALGRAGTIDQMKSQRMVANAVPTGAPVIAREGVRSGVYSWEIEMPVMVTFHGARTNTTQRLLLTAVVARVPTSVNKFGVGIDHYVARER